MAAELLSCMLSATLCSTPSLPIPTCSGVRGAFDFNETDDQLSAIRDIKRDMESPQPMDRLLSRRRLWQDRGRHARRVQAVQDSKQVAVLTPTTVLSFQHYESFKRRFANFPSTSR